MMNKREITYIIATIIILAFVISLTDIKTLFFPILAAVFIVILVNIIAKKITSYYFDSEIEIKPWEISQWGYKRHQHFKKSIPIGMFLPILIKLISFGFINWTAALTFDVKAKVYRTAKRRGLYAYYDISEYQIGIIAAIGIAANIIFALIGYLVGFTDFARISIGYAFFNMIPLTQLDGNKVFFGSLPLWIFLAIIVLIGALSSLFII